MKTTRREVRDICIAWKKERKILLSIRPELKAFAHLSLAIVDGEQFDFARSEFAQINKTKWVREIDRLLNRYRAPSMVVPARVNIVERFRMYADANGISILRILQESRDDDEVCCAVILAIDTDGIVKIFKELVVSDEPCGDGARDLESTLFEKIGNHATLARYYGTVEIDSTLSFLRREVVWGQTLLDFMREDRSVPQEQAVHIVLELAKALAEFHRRGVVYEDLKPKNVLIHGNDVRLFDLNASRCVKHLNEEIDTHLMDPRYAPPEMTLRHRASTASDVFQLGILFHQLVYGKHPFDVCPEMDGANLGRSEAILRFALPSALCLYVESKTETTYFQKSLISAMLFKDPAKRPSMEDVVSSLTPYSVSDTIVRHPPHSAPPRVREKNTVLFPARMGVPHKGHIEFIARLLELGFFVRISLQYAYICTDRDPVPKWLVQKMVTRSLLDLGFREIDFDFLLTPFFETDEQHRLHFSAMPHREDVVVVASSNPDVHELFSGYPILNQASVFGFEGETFEDRSWGEELRSAIRCDDRHAFARLAASGVTTILSFQELKGLLTDTAHRIEFVPGHVFVELIDEEEERLFRKRVHTYSTPEKTILRALNDISKDSCFHDSTRRNTHMQFRGTEYFLTYDRVLFDGTNETIYYRLLPRS